MWTIAGRVRRSPGQPPGKMMVAALTAIHAGLRWPEAEAGWMDELIPVIVAVIAAAIAVILALAERRAARIDRKRTLFADALADVLRWVEFPYRIRRRSPSDEDRHEIVLAMHELQTRLTHHGSWLRLEDQRVADAFDELLSSAKERAADHMRAAWQADPITDDAGMNVEAIFPVSLSAEVDAYVAAVRRTLAFWTRWL